MRGIPLLRFALVFVALGAVAWPLCHVILHQAVPHKAPALASGTAESSISPEGKRPTLRATLLLHATPSPQHFQISQGDRTLLSEKDLISPGEYRSAVEITKGEDLHIQAGWEDDDPHALRVEVLVHGYQAPLEKNFWGQKSVEDTFPIPSSFLS